MPVRTRREDSKRTRLSRTAQVPSDSSEISTCSVSEASALQSTPGMSEENRQSSFSSVSALDDDHSESSVSESSSDDNSSSSEDHDVEQDEEEEIVTLGGPMKPWDDPKRVLEEAHKLQCRLQELLPKLNNANRELAKKGATLSMEEVDDDEQHIEMNLGLGVLEEQHNSDDEDALNEGQAVPRNEASCGKDDAARESESETDVMRSLLGTDKNHEKPGIEEVEGTRSDI